MNKIERQEFLAKEISKPRAIDVLHKSVALKREHSNNNLKPNLSGKTYVFESPEGIQIQVTNITQFAKENKLIRQNLYSLISGEYGQHKGFRYITTIYPTDDETINISISPKRTITVTGTVTVTPKSTTTVTETETIEKDIEYNTNSNNSSFNNNLNTHSNNIHDKSIVTVSADEEWISKYQHKPYTHQAKPKFTQEQMINAVRMNPMPSAWTDADRGIEEWVEELVKQHKIYIESENSNGI